MHRYGNLATKLWKKCWKGAPFWKGNPFIAGTLESRGPPRCPLSPDARGFAHPEPIGVTPLGGVHDGSKGVDCTVSMAVILWSSQSVCSIRCTATMEMGTFHFWGAIELSILDQVWQMRCQHYCDLTGGNWQKWKRVFLTCPCHEIYRDEAVDLKSCKNTWKITIFVKMWNLGQYRENLIFCQ